MEATFVLCLLGVLVVLMAIEKPRADLAALLGLAILILSGTLRHGQALAGFSNPATVAVAAMFVLSAGLESSGLVRWAGDRLLKRGPSNVRWFLLLCGLLIGPISAFLNNTAAVAVFLPMALAACHGKGISPSRVLMSLSFFAMLGGSCTLIGTSTNILVSSYAADHGLRPFGMFEFSVLGAVLFGAGAVYLTLLAPRLSPSHVPAENLIEDHHVNPYLTEVVVLEGSPLAGRTLSASHIGEQYELEVLSLCRDGDVIGLPGPDDHVQVGDVLIVQAPLSVLMGLRDDMGIAVKEGRHPDAVDLRAEDTELVEAVVAPNSGLEGRTLRQLDFRRRFGALVLAIRRHGEDIVEQLGRVRLRAGDELLVLGHTENLEQLRRRARLVVLQALDLPRFLPARVLISGLIVVGVVVAAAAKLLPIAEAAVVGAILMVASRCVTMRQAYASIDWKVIFLLAGLIPLGSALESSGAASMTVHGLLALVGDYGPTVVLSAFYLLTALLTGVMSNNATAVLLAPLAVTTARDMGVDARPFLVAVTFAASAAFYTPIGYQTNMLVYGPGGYRFTDFLRLGGPLNLLIWILASLLIPRFFPF